MMPIEIKENCYLKAEEIEKHLTSVYTHNIEPWLENDREYLRLVCELQELVKEYYSVKKGDVQKAYTMANELISTAKSNAKFLALQKRRKKKINIVQAWDN